MHVDLIIESKRVFTGAGLTSAPAAIAVSGDQIVAVGPHADVQAFASSSNTGEEAAEIRDFGDALIVPGFHDSHLHFFHSAVYSSPLATTFLGESEADCVARMRKLAERRPNGWLLAQGWREYRWNPPILPTKQSLDEAFPERPVALYSGDAHTLWLNSVALTQLGIHRDSMPPSGGSYDRDAAGELTGIVREAAAMELMPHIMGAFSNADITDAYRGFFAQLATNGVTSVCDLSLMASPGLDFVRDDIHESLLAQGGLTARVHLFPTLTADLSRFENMRERYTEPLLRAAGFKQFFDGVSSQHTAWIHQPYANAHSREDCGQPTVDPHIMRELVLRAAKAGFPVRIHTIGDEAIHTALNIFEEARNLFGALPHGARNCLEHVENFLPEDLARLAELQVIAAVQPPHITLDPGGPERDLGHERIPYMWPLRTLLNQNTVLAFGTDSPVVDVNSMNVLYCAVSRQDPTTHQPAGGWLPSERIGMPEALRAYTQGSAAAAGRARELGILAPGMLADIAVVDRDLIGCAIEDIQKARILATFTGGRCVFEQ